MKSQSYLEGLGLPGRDLYDLPSSSLRFPDGEAFHLEIPSTEGPDAFEAVLDEARKHNIRVHRVSQGSGIWMLTDEEIQRMVAIGADNDVEVCLFVGPRASWDTGRQATTPGGQILSGSLRGADQLSYGLEDVIHGCDLGVRSILVADLGQLYVIGKLKEKGDLPSDLIVKVSASLPVANPAAARLYEDLGATTLNLAVDLTLPALAAIRSAVTLPVDLYIESSDDFGGIMRYYEIPEIVRIAAPVHLKFAVRNSPGVYPSGGHLQSQVELLSRERVRRAALGLAMLDRLG
ncbi:MAG: U32 family peptidase [Rhodoglobus sp.]